MARPSNLNVIVGFVTLLTVSVHTRAADDCWKATGSQAAVATGGAESADAALAVLQGGGNAVDAAVAAMLVLSVTDHLIGSFNQTPPQLGSLTLSESFGAEPAAELEKRGHRVARKAAPLGHPVMLVFGPQSGEISAAGDPAAHRHARAY